MPPIEACEKGEWSEERLTVKDLIVTAAVTVSQPIGVDPGKGKRVSFVTMV